ncbi:MAG: DUF4142 domain-containing protein [Labilithrix sp.]|nr:DUF4142 domain-containing protein [Labilithrix sp.]
MHARLLEVVMLAGLAGCSTGNSATLTNESAASVDDGGSSQEPVATFSPAEANNIAIALHQAVIDQSQLAIAQGGSPDVKAFARLMVDDHEKALARGKSLAERLGVVPGTDATSQLLQREAQLVTQHLGAMSGADLDMAYMTAQIASHAKVLGLLDRALIPSVAQARAYETLTASAGGTAPPKDLETELTDMRARVLERDRQALLLQRTVRGAPQ